MKVYALIIAILTYIFYSKVKFRGACPCCLTLYKNRIYKEVWRPAHYGELVEGHPCTHTLLSCCASPSSDAVARTQGDNPEGQLCLKCLFQKQLSASRQPNPWGTLWVWGDLPLPRPALLGCRRAGSSWSPSFHTASLHHQILSPVRERFPPVSDLQ